MELIILLPWHTYNTTLHVIYMFVYLFPIPSIYSPPFQNILILFVLILYTLMLMEMSVWKCVYLHAHLNDRPGNSNQFRIWIFFSNTKHSHVCVCVRSIFWLRSKCEMHKLISLIRVLIVWMLFPINFTFDRAHWHWHWNPHRVQLFVVVIGAVWNGMWYMDGMVLRSLFWIRGILNING